MLGHASNREILRQMDKLVIGHERAKKLLITLVQRSKMAHRQRFLLTREKNAPELEKMNLLLIGSSGTGKTHLLESLQKLVHFPLVKVDGSRLNPEANQSFSYKDIQQAIIANAKDLVEHEELPYFSVEGAIDQTVVFVDEMDKLCTAFGKNDGWHTRTQSELLTLVENQELFKNVSFVFAGAFTALRQPKKTTSVGFSSTDVGEKVERKTITEEDLTQFGLTTELLGRITAINELDVLTHETMATILNNLILPNKLAAMSYFVDNPKSAITNTMKDEWIEAAIESGQGVRYLKRIVNDLFLDMEFEHEDRKRIAVVNQ